MHARKADQIAGLADERRVRALCRKPGVLEARVLDLAHDIQTPILRLLGLISQALERDPDLDLVPPLGEPPAGLEHVIGAEVGSLTADEGAADESARRNVGSFDERAVSLYTTRIHREHQRLLPVVERAEQDRRVGKECGSQW